MAMQCTPWRLRQSAHLSYSFTAINIITCTFITSSDRLNARKNESNLIPPLTIALSRTPRAEVLRPRGSQCILGKFCLHKGWCEGCKARMVVILVRISTNKQIDIGEGQNGSKHEGEGRKLGERISQRWMKVTSIYRKFVRKRLGGKDWPRVRRPKRSWNKN